MTFFSGTDRNTLIKEGMSMPHFLSLIVNNAGIYTAKITRRVSFQISKINYPTFKGERKSEEVDSTIDEYLEAFSLEINIQEDTSIKDEVIQRIEEINTEKVKVKKLDSSFYKEKENTLFTKENNSFSINQSLTQKTFIQPTLLCNKDESWINIEVPQELAQKLLIQLVTGSITSGYSDKFELDKWCSSVMEKAFFRRFPDPYDLENWLDIYTEFLIWNTIWNEVKDIDSDILSKAIANKLLTMCEQLPNNKILESIKVKLENIIE